MIRPLTLAALLIATPASAEICFELPHHPVKRISSAPRPVSVVRVMRIRIGPPRTHAADLTFACPVEEPAETFVTVVYGPGGPIDMGFEPVNETPENEQVAPPLLTSRPPQMVADRSLYLGPIVQTVSAIPEPGTWAQLLAGFIGLGVAMRRQRIRSRGFSRRPA